MLQLRKLSEVSVGISLRMAKVSSLAARVWQYAKFRSFRRSCLKPARQHNLKHAGSQSFREQAGHLLFGSDSSASQKVRLSSWRAVHPPMPAQCQVRCQKHSGSQVTAMIAIELDLHYTYEAVTWWKGLQLVALAATQCLEGCAVPNACKLGKSAFRSIQAVG